MGMLARAAFGAGGMAARELDARGIASRGALGSAGKGSRGTGTTLPPFGRRSFGWKG